MGFLSGAVVVMSLAASATTLECQVTKVINKLGYQMSVHRHRIATSTDEEVVFLQ